MWTSGYGLASRPVWENRGCRLQDAGWEALTWKIGACAQVDGTAAWEQVRRVRIENAESEVRFSVYCGPGSRPVKQEGFREAEVRYQDSEICC